MQDVKSRYAELFNGRHGQTGHLFGVRYAHRLVTSEAHLMNVYSYIALNPVRAGMCARPEDWWWSSYSGVLAHREGALFDRESLRMRGGTDDEVCVASLSARSRRIECAALAMSGV